MGCESHLYTSYFILEVFPMNYVVYRKDRNVGGGGVVAIKDDLTTSYKPILSISAELIWAKLIIVRVGMNLLYICSFFRPPNSEIWNLF